jgi:hypothetical protein
MCEIAEKANSYQENGNLGTVKGQTFLVSCSAHNNQITK